MSEKPPVQKEGEPRINMEMILMNSFLLSQGDPNLQKELFRGIFSNPHYANKLVTALENQNIKTDMIAQYARNKAQEGMHTSIDTEDPEEEAASQLEIMRMIAKEEAVESTPTEERYQEQIRTLARDLIHRDAAFVISKGMLARPGPSNPDPFASFVIRFCILKTGTRSFPFGILQKPFQDLCEDVGRVIMQRKIPLGTQAELKRVIEVVKDKDTNLTEEEKIKINALYQRLR